MLNKSMVNRLSNFGQIKNDPWFRDFSWENMLALNITPPYVPTLPEKDFKNNPVAFINHLKLVKEWVPSKPVKLDKATQEQYEKWFKEF
jgi:hypothetical protein